ncbi:MAG: site-2 protease family protein [Planctomycetota bacterium]|nr:site-2 protease family protein [Planctomycetota bacterium]
MYRDSFSETGFTKILRWLSASFGIGRYFRVQVRVFYVAAVVMPLILLRNVESLPVGAALGYIVLTTLALYVVIWSHEMGHILAGRRYGIETPLITLSPLGGVAHMGSGAPTPGKEIVIALAGPVTHLAWLAVFFPLYLFVDYGDLAPDSWSYDQGYGLITTLVYINVGLLAFNLLPCFPMDGGRALRGFLAKRMHPNRATLIAVRIGTVAGFVFIAVGIGLWIMRDDLSGTILACIGISNVLACKQERLAALSGPGPYMTANLRQPWESDPDGWKRGTRTESAEPGFFERRRAAREAHQRERDDAADAALQGELDRVLDRVNEVGLDQLTAAERKILTRASKRRRPD